MSGLAGVSPVGSGGETKRKWSGAGNDAPPMKASKTNAADTANSVSAAGDGHAGIGSNELMAIGLLACDSENRPVYSHHIATLIHAADASGQGLIRLQKYIAVMHGKAAEYGTQNAARRSESSLRDSWALHEAAKAAHLIDADDDYVHFITALLKARVETGKSASSAAGLLAKISNEITSHTNGLASRAQDTKAPSGLPQPRSLAPPLAPPAPRSTSHFQASFSTSKPRRPQERRSPDTLARVTRELSWDFQAINFEKSNLKMGVGGAETKTEDEQETQSGSVSGVPAVTSVPSTAVSTQEQPAANGPQSAKITNAAGPRNSAIFNVSNNSQHPNSVDGPGKVSTNSASSIAPSQLPGLPRQPHFHEWRLPNNPTQGVYLPDTGSSPKAMHAACQLAFAPYGFVGVETLGGQYFVRLDRSKATRDIAEMVALPAGLLIEGQYHRVKTLDTASSKAFSAHCPGSSPADIIAAVDRAIGVSFALLANNGNTVYTVVFAAALRTDAFQITRSKKKGKITLGFNAVEAGLCVKCNRVHPTERRCGRFLAVSAPGFRVPGYDLKVLDSM